jgi:hypothetical protein
MKSKNNKLSPDLLLGNEKHLPDRKGSADKIFRRLVCVAEQLGSEMDHHPAPHCKKCGSKLVEEVG